MSARRIFGAVLAVITMIAGMAGSPGIAQAVTHSGVVRTFNVAPTLSGNAVAGDTLTANEGSFTGTPPTFTYAWYQCTSAHNATAATVPGDCTAIARATRRTFVVTVANASKFILVKVTGKAGAVSTTVVSATVGAVTVKPYLAATPRNNKVRVTGNTTVGSLATIAPGTWTGTPNALSYVYSWWSCSSPVVADVTSAPPSCVQIDNAAGTTYTTITTQIGKYISPAVSVTNAAGTTTRWAAVSSQLVGTPVYTAPPVITGDPSVSVQLGLDLTTEYGFPIDKHKYDWYLCTNAHTANQMDATGQTPPGDCTVKLSNSNNSTFTPTTADKGKYVVARINTYWRGARTPTLSVFTGSTTDILGPPAAPTAASIPMIFAAQTPLVGQTFRGATGTWSGSPRPTIHLNWYSCTQPHTVESSVPNDCSSVGSADNLSYTAALADLGKYIVFAVTAQNGLASITATSASTEVVNLPAPEAVEAPRISRTLAQASQTGLVVVGGYWPSLYSQVTTYAWYVCVAPHSVTSVRPSGCTLVPSQNSGAFTPRLSDAGKYVSAAVTVTNASASSTLWTESAAVVSDPVPDPGAPVSVAKPIIVKNDQAMFFSGSYNIYVATEGEWSSAETPTIEYQWFKCTTPHSASNTLGSDCTQIDNMISNSYNTSGDQGKYLTIGVTATNSAGATTAYAATTSAVPLPPTGVIQLVTEPDVSGLPQVGASASIAANASFVDFNSSQHAPDAHLWMACDHAPTDPTAYEPLGCQYLESLSGYSIANMFATSVEIKPILIGKYLVNRQVFANGFAEKHTYSRAIGPVIGLPSFSIDPSISGGAYVGGALSASPGVWANDPNARVSYQWSWCWGTVAAADTLDGGCTVIPGAVTNNYVPTSDTRDRYAVVAVTLTNALGSVTRVSATSDQIGRPHAPPVNIDSPNIVNLSGGAPARFDSLHGNRGVWSDADGYATYWLVCSQPHYDSSSRIPVDCYFDDFGELDLFLSSPRYVNRYIMYLVVAYNSWGSTYATSPTTTAVTP